MKREITAATEAEAKTMRRTYVNADYRVSLIGFDPARDLYAFDVEQRRG